MLAGESVAAEVQRFLTDSTVSKRNNGFNLGPERLQTVAIQSVKAPEDVDQGDYYLLIEDVPGGAVDRAPFWSGDSVPFSGFIIAPVSGIRDGELVRGMSLACRPTAAEQGFSFKVMRGGRWEPVSPAHVDSEKRRLAMPSPEAIFPGRSTPFALIRIEYTTGVDAPISLGSFALDVTADVLSDGKGLTNLKLTVTPQEDRRPLEEVFGKKIA